MAMVLRVKVASSASSDWKLWTGRPSAVRLVAALRRAASERCAGVTMEDRAAAASAQRLAHVPLEIIGEHAQQHVGADPIGQAVVDRSDLKIDGLDGPKGAFGLAQALVDPHDITCSERCLLEIGADEIEA